MKFVFLLALVCCAVWAEDAQTAAADLGRLASRISAGENPSLPDSWTIETNDGSFSISASPAKELLERKQRTEASEWLRSRALALASYAKPATNVLRAENELNAILSRPEFTPEAPPSTWERFRNKLGRWVFGIFSRVLSAIGHLIPAELLFWVVGSAALIFAIILFVHRTQQETTLHLSGGPSLRSFRTWEEWIGMARAAVGCDDFRSAIQCCYWAGVLRLQAAGGLPSDRARTPREYLRTLKGETAAPFRRLTVALERCWYGYQPATNTDVEECMRSLEAIGCRLD